MSAQDCGAAECAEGDLDEVGAVPGLVQAVRRALPPPPVEYLHVVEVLGPLLAPEPSGRDGAGIYTV